jgi:hypothetical protein
VTRRPPDTTINAALVRLPFGGSPRLAELRPPRRFSGRSPKSLRRLWLMIRREYPYCVGDRGVPAQPSRHVERVPDGWVWTTQIRIWGRFGVPTEGSERTSYPLAHPQLPFATTAANGGDGWKSVIPDLPGPMCAWFQSGHSLREARIPNAAPITALPLVGRKAEGYHPRRGVAASLSLRITAWM